MKKLFTLTVVLTALFYSGIAQTCDTLINLKSTMDTPTVYIADTGTGAGYLSGNNVYGDLAKAEGFTTTAGSYVTGAEMFFGVITINSADSNNMVTIGVWDNTGTDITGAAGGPGNMIDSVHVTLKQISTAANNQALSGALIVNFTGAAAIPADTVYIGVVLPTVTGDTLALLTNTFYGPDGNGWEYEYNYNTQDGTNAWGSYDVDFNITTGSLGNYIAADICSSGPTGISTITDGVSYKMYPNPANDQLNFQWNVNAEADVVMFDVTGNAVNTFTINGTSLNSFDIHNLNAGTYIIRITDRANNIQRSAIFTKM